MAIAMLQDKLRTPTRRWASLLFLILGFSTLLQLLVSMLLAEGAYKLQSLNEQHQSLEIEVQIIAQEVDSLASPQFLADSANRLGMVANPSPVFLDLEAGKVIGDQRSASKGGAVASRNLVANSVLGSVELPAEAEVAASGVEENSSGAADEVVSLDVIPASPTR